MKNWFAKLLKYEKPVLAISQGDTSIYTAPTETKETTWEDANIVSSSSSIPVEAESPSPDNKEKETQILFEAFKKLTPEYFFVIAEMRNLLNSQIKKIVFHALSTGLSIDQVATHLGITNDEVSVIYREAIVDIQIQSGFVRRYLNNGVRREYAASELETNTQKPDLRSRLDDDTTKKALLSEPLHECLNIETRTLTAFRILDLYTLEDLLRFVSAKGLEALKRQRNFGQLSLDKLTSELIRKGIFKPDGSCELYKYISDINKEEP